MSDRPSKRLITARLLVTLALFAAALALPGCKGCTEDRTSGLPTGR